MIVDREHVPRVHRACRQCRAGVYTVHRNTSRLISIGRGQLLDMPRDDAVLLLIVDRCQHCPSSQSAPGLPSESHRSCDEAASAIRFRQQGWFASTYRSDCDGERRPRLGVRRQLRRDDHLCDTARLYLSFPRVRARLFQEADDRSLDQSFVDLTVSGTGQADDEARADHEAVAGFCRGSWASSPLAGASHRLLTSRAARVSSLGRTSSFGSASVFFVLHLLVPLAFSRSCDHLTTPTQQRCASEVTGCNGLRPETVTED